MVPLARLARCAAASMPRASPETTAKPASPRSRASRSAKRTPAADALRAPTTATAGRLSAAALPRTAKSGRVVDHLQTAGIIGLAEHAESFRCLEFARGVLAGGPGRPRGAAASGEIGYRGKRRPRAAVMIVECAEGARPHIVAADKTQPIKPLLVAEPHALALVGHTAPRGRLILGDNIADV